MEELNLKDLSFDESSMNLFDGDGNLESKNNDGADAGDAGKGQEGDQGKQPERSQEGKNNTDGDGTGNAGQESVANQGKDNQVQTGKASEDGEGSNSSSPKLNETEQLYSNLAAEFKAKGVLPGLEDIKSIRSLEDLNKALQSEVNSRLDNEQATIKKALETGAPVGEVSQKMQAIQQLEGVTPEFLEDEKNLAFRKEAIIQDFVEKGYGKERAEILAQRSIDAGTDVEDAKFAIKSIIEAEKKSLQSILDEAAKKEADSLNDIKDYISKTPEVIPGIQLTDSQKDELYSQITTDLGNKENAFMVAQKADPVGSRIKLEALFYLTKGLTDFSVFGNAAETKISNNIENLLRGANFTEEGKVKTEVNDNNSNFILSSLKDLKIE